MYYIHSTPSQPRHHNTPPNLEQVRAQIESQCTLIAKGQASIDSVVAHSLRNFEAKYRFFVNRIDVRAFLMVFVSCMCVERPMVDWPAPPRMPSHTNMKFHS